MTFNAKEHFKVGDRVEILSDFGWILGESRNRKRTGTVTGFSLQENRMYVRRDGAKTPVRYLASAWTLKIDDYCSPSHEMTAIGITSAAPAREDKTSTKSTVEYAALTGSPALSVGQRILGTSIEIGYLLSAACWRLKNFVFGTKSK